MRARDFSCCIEHAKGEYAFMVWRVWFVMLVGVWSSGCVSDEDPHGSTAVFCEGLCEGMSRCGTWPASAPGCQSDCVERQVGFTDLSESFADRYGKCVSRAQCSTFFDEATFDHCWEVAKMEATPSESTRSFCERFVRSAFECGYGDTPQGCERDFGVWSGGIIERMSDCTGSATCEDVVSCVNGVFASL